MSAEIRELSSPASKQPSVAPLPAVARGLALFIGGFTLLNLCGELLIPHFDANLWWIDTRMLPAWVAQLLLLAAACALLAFAVCPLMSAPRRQFTRAGILGLLALTLWNATAFYLLLLHGAIRTRMPIPFSVFIAAALLLLLRAMPRAAPGKGYVMVLTLLCCLVGFPLAQMYCFGETDYRRSADIIVVFGARAFADGRPSRALAERVKTASALYQGGYAPLLLFSGGPGDGAVHEAEAMRNLAVRLGVPTSAIILDRRGMDTHATAVNSLPLFRQRGIRRVLAVSHFYHLPRIKMTYQRAGWDIYTVPARGARPLRHLPALLLREVVALWAYYVSPDRRF